MTSRFAPDVRAALRAAPKVELHLHLDGALAIPWLLERVRRRPEAGVAPLEALRARLAFRTFDEFIERWVWKCQSRTRSWLTRRCQGVMVARHRSANRRD